MKKKLIITLLGIILSLALVAAVFYPEPFVSNLDINDYNISNADYISANYFNGTFIGEVVGLMNWTKLQNYPSSCPGSSAITTINDSTVCSDLWFDVTGNETITGNMTFSGGHILNLSSINITGNANVVGNFTGNQFYGEMWFHNDTAGNVTVLTEDAWANVTAFEQVDNGQSLNGFSYSSNTLTAIIAGLYKADYHMTFSGTANNKYHTAIAINDVLKLQTESHDRIDSGTDVLGVGGTGFLQVAVDDRINLQMMNEDSSGDGTVFAVNLNLVRIGG